MKIQSLSASILMLALFSANIYSQKKTAPDKKPIPTTESLPTKYGALSIDRSNGFFFGWAAGCSSLSEAEKKSIEECSKKGGKCTVVLSYSGTGCAAYRFITGNVGTGFGWGLAKTKEEADVIAKKECSERSFGLPAPNFVWSCNGANSGNLKEIYNAHSEIINAPGTITDY